MAFNLCPLHRSIWNDLSGMAMRPRIPIAIRAKTERDKNVIRKQENGRTVIILNMGKHLSDYLAHQK